MKKRKETKPIEVSYSDIPPVSPDDAEQLGISLAYDLAFQRLRNGTATAQEVTYFLKLGSIKSRLENEKLRNENAMLREKVKTYQAARESDVDYAKVIEAMKRYNGNFSDTEDYEDYVEFEEFDDD